METKILEWLVDWFYNNTNLSKEEISNNLDANYFEDGWIDSFKFILFISEIESQFGVSFSNDNFQDRSFSTINGIALMIRRLLNEER